MVKSSLASDGVFSSKYWDLAPPNVLTSVHGAMYNIALRFNTFKENYMYAIVKTGGKQYKVTPGEYLSVEKLDAEVGEKVELEVICVVDGSKVDLDTKAKAVATVLDQYKDKKKLVFKFKKRKNYKKLRGHRQNLTRIQIESIGE